MLACTDIGSFHGTVSGHLSCNTASAMCAHSAFSPGIPFPSWPVAPGAGARAAVYNPSCCLWHCPLGWWPGQGPRPFATRQIKQSAGVSPGPCNPMTSIGRRFKSFLCGFLQDGIRKKMFKICSESFSGLPIHCGLYVLCIKQREVHIVKSVTLTEAQPGETGSVFMLPALCYRQHLHYFMKSLQ